MARHLLRGQRREGAVPLQAHPQPGLGVLAGGKQLEGPVFLVRLAQLKQRLVFSHRHGHQGHAAVPGRLPGPGLGPPLAAELGQGAVGVLVHGHQGHPALIHFGLGVHNGKDALRPRHGGQQGVHLHGDLVDGLGDLPVVLEVGHQRAQGEAGVDPGAHGQGGPQHGGDGVAHVGQVGGDGHDGGGVEPGLAGRRAVVLVEGLKPGLGLLLVVEGFDHLQALDHLLDVAVHRSQRALLPGEILPAASAEQGEHRQHRPQHHQGAQEQQRGQGHHHGHHPHEGDHAGDELDHRLLKGRLHVVRVVGEAAHELAVGVGVEVAQGELLELVEQLPAHTVAALEGQLGHQVGLEVSAPRRDQIGSRQLDAGGYQLREAGLPGGQGQGEAVEDGLLQVGGPDAQQGFRHHAGQHRGQQDGPVHNVFHGAQGGFAQVLGLAEAPPGPPVGAARPAGAVGTAVVVLSHCPPLLPAGSHRFPCRFRWRPSAGRGSPPRPRPPRPAPRSCRPAAPS